MNVEIRDKALAEFLCNPHWRSIYENAPDGARRYYEISFASSTSLISSVESKAEHEAIYPELTAADWEYMINTCGNAQAKWHMQQRRKTYIGGGGERIIGNDE